MKKTDCPKSIIPTINLWNNLCISLPLCLTIGDKIPNDDVVNLRLVPACTHMMMSILAFLFSCRQWHIGQFLMLITRSNVSSKLEPEFDPELEPEESSVSEEVPEDWWVGYDDGGVFCAPLLTSAAASARGCWLNSVGYVDCASSGTLSTPSSSNTSRSCNKCIVGPEKSSFPSCSGVCVDKDQLMHMSKLPSVLGVLKLRSDPPSSTGTTLFFSFRGHLTCISRHCIALSTVSSSSTGLFPLRVKKELTVSEDRVDLRESSMDVNLMYESMPVSSVLYCLRYCLQNY